MARPTTVLDVTIHLDGTTSTSSNWDIRWFHDLTDEFETKVRQRFDEQRAAHPDIKPH